MPADPNNLMRTDEITLEWREEVHRSVTLTGNELRDLLGINGTPDDELLHKAWTLLACAVYRDRLSDLDNARVVYRGVVGLQRINGEIPGDLFL